MAPYRTALLAFAATVAVVLAGVVAVCRSSQMPAPRISASKSFNEKALWLRRALREGRKGEVLVVGSSMGLDNLDGGELAAITGNSDVVNACSFGMSVDEILRLTQEMLERFHPRLVIFPLYHGDFIEFEDKDLDWGLFKQCLDARSLAFLYAKTPDVLYYKENYALQKSAAARERRIYESLNFDATGGVPLNPRNFIIEPARWDRFKEQSLEEIRPNPDCLNKLREWCDYLRGRKIPFLVVACPMRQAAEEKFGPELNRTLWPEVKGIVEGDGGRFAHIEGGTDYDDALFADYCHLNSDGAKKMTGELSGVLREAYSKGR